MLRIDKSDDFHVTYPLLAPKRENDKRLLKVISHADPETSVAENNS